MAAPAVRKTAGRCPVLGADPVDGVDTVIVGAAGEDPQRPNTQPPTFLPSVGRTVAFADTDRWSAAISVNSRVRLSSDALGMRTGRAACAIVALTTGWEEKDRALCAVRSSCEGLDFRVWISMPDIDMRDSCELALLCVRE